MDHEALALGDTITLRHATQGRVIATILLAKNEVLTQDSEHPAIGGRTLLPWTVESLHAFWRGSSSVPLTAIHYSVVHTFAAGDWPSVEASSPALVGRGLR